MTSPWRSIAWFVTVTFGVSWAIEIGLRPFGVPLAIRAVLAMFVPALTATALRGPVLHEGFADAALRPNLRARWRIYVLAVTIVPCCLAIASLLALATHVQHIDPVNDMLQLLHDAGAPPDAVPAARIPQMLAAGTLAALTIAVPINALFTFGEEFGWRGYLLPQLLRAMPATPAALLVGAIWGAWHAPLILLDGFNFPNDRPLGVVFMIALCMAMSLILCALRLASHSIWPSSLAHAALNAQAGVVLVLLAPLYSYAGAPLGLAAIVVFAVAGVVLMRTLIPR